MSIFTDLKKKNCFNGESGEFELKLIYMEYGISIKEQLSLATEMSELIINLYKSGDSYEKLDLKKYTLIKFIPAFMGKINALIKENIIKEKWMKELTNDLIYNSNIKEQVQLGLVLAEKYIERSKLKEIIDTFVKSGEYIFYLTRTIKSLPKYNRYLLNLSRKSYGTIKVFAITNIEIINYDITEFLMEKGYKDENYENLLINYILSMCDICEYLDVNYKDQNKINNVTFLIYRHLRTCSLSKSPLKEFLVKDYIDIVGKVNASYYNMMSMLLIGQGIAILEQEGKMKKEEYIPIVNILKENKWRQLFIKEIRSSYVNTLDIVELANFYDYEFSVDEVKYLNDKSPLDFCLYWYINNKGSNEARKLLLGYFYKEVNVNSLICSDDCTEKNKSENQILDIIFSTVIKGCRRMYPQGKEIALKGIFSNSTNVRKEALSTLMFTREHITENEMELIKKASEYEKNGELKSNFRKIIQGSDLKENEFVELEEIKDIKVTRHSKDTLLLSTYVYGIDEKNSEKVDKEINRNKMFYLISDPDNFYDNKTVKVVSQSGCVIGEIPRKDNEIVTNLLSKGIYLYCMVRDYSMEERHVSIDIYISYKNVLDEAEQLFKVLTATDTGVYEN
ncbi:MAG: HIRAN domain-containing protein [Clostridium sp.]|nr:HIRAN domain-containing protein [Clostridium sp.]